jgi:SpoVK/Ycf46/Vps4 family AAA+-type ATPase
MVEYLSEFTFSLYSLLACLILPFLYFAFHLKYYFNAVIIKRLDALFAVVNIILFGFFIYNLVEDVKREGSFSFRYTLLPLLHFLPLLLNFILLYFGRAFVYSQVSATSKQGPNQTQKDADLTSYTPTPINREVQFTGWNQLIINSALRQELMSIVELLKDPKTASRYGIEVPKGILLSGPPGTGKTSIAKVIASTANMAFFSLKTDEVVSKWVGDSEKNLTKLFEAAKRHAPAVIFMDEVDSIGGSRQGGDSQKWHDNLLNHLLQQIDGLVKTEGLYIIAATNRPDLVDAALKRSGRLNRVIEVPLPGFEARVQLFQLYLARLKLGEAIDLGVLGQLTNEKSCADIKEICNQAALNSFKRESAQGKRTYTVSNLDIAMALEAFGANTIS